MYEGALIWLDHHRVLSIVSEQDADFVVVNAGGLSLRPEKMEVAV